MRAFALCFVAALAIGAAGCSDDEETPTPIEDSGDETAIIDSSTTDSDIDTGTPADSATDSAADGDADAGIDFADFVKGLINTETKPNTKPTTTDDKSYPDKQLKSEYDVLFP